MNIVPMTQSNTIPPRCGSLKQDNPRESPKPAVHHPLILLGTKRALKRRLEKACTNGQVQSHSKRKDTRASCQGYLLVGAGARQCMFGSIQ